MLTRKILLGYLLWIRTEQTFQLNLGPSVSKHEKQLVIENFIYPYSQISHKTSF